MRKIATGEELHQVLIAYNGPLKDCFYMVVALAALLAPVALGMEWKDIRKKPHRQTTSIAAPVDGGKKQEERVEDRRM